MIFCVGRLNVLDSSWDLDSRKIVDSRWRRGVYLARVTDKLDWDSRE